MNTIFHSSHIIYRPNAGLRMVCKITGLVLAVISIFLTARLFYQLSDNVIEQWTLALVGVAVEALKIAMAAIGAGLLLRNQAGGAIPLAIAILIMLLSFGASMGFMSSSNITSQHAASESSAEYSELSNHIELKMMQIQSNAQVIATNGSSRHASKRALAIQAATDNEQLTADIEQLKQDRESLKGKTITTSSSAFTAIGSLIHANAEQTRAVVFSVVAVLLEVLSVMCFAYSSEGEAVEAKYRTADSALVNTVHNITEPSPPEPNRPTPPQDDQPTPPPTRPNGGNPKPSFTDRARDVLGANPQPATNAPAYATQNERVQAVQTEKRTDSLASVSVEQPFTNWGYMFNNPTMTEQGASATDEKTHECKEIRADEPFEPVQTVHLHAHGSREAIQLDTGRGDHDGHRYRAIKAAIERGELKPSQRAIKEYLAPCDWSTARNYQQWLLEEGIIQPTGNSYKLAEMQEQAKVNVVPFLSG